MGRRSRYVLLLVNVVSTTLTLLTGFRENALITFATGRFGLIRSRLEQGRINYAIARLDQLPVDSLPDLKRVGTHYDIHETPTRSPSNLAEDRNVCLRVNSMGAASMAMFYDDMFGKGARREQVFLFSISTPRCEIINFDPHWLQHHCVDSLFHGNASACHAYIAADFEQLQQRREIQIGIPVDFGGVGSPFLKCVGRPSQSFLFGADLLVLQSFWAGQSYLIEIQSSVCYARPRVQLTTAAGLFQVEAADQQAVVLVAVAPVHWTLSFVPTLYAVITLAMITRGLMSFLNKRRDVPYISSTSSSATTTTTTTTTSAVWRIASWSVKLAMLLRPIREQIHIVRFSATSSLAGSNRWMNHWLYITVSIVDSAMHLQKLYSSLEMGTWMLSKQVSVENFLFICSTLTRLTWLTCLFHTLVRVTLVALLRAIDRAVLNWTGRRSRVCMAGTWYVNAAALLINFKIYSFLLVLQLYVLLKIHGSTTLMKADEPLKRPVYGGFADIATMWRSEVVCNFLVVVMIQVGAGHLLASLLLLLVPPLRHATHNKLLQILQRRYVFVGWDVYVAMDALGIDPFQATQNRTGDGHVTSTVAMCTIAALTRQLYASGPSGWVRFAGDSIFTKTSHHTSSSLPLQRYPLALADAMGFVIASDGSHALLTTEPLGGGAGPVVAPGGRSVERELAGPVAMQLELDSQHERRAARVVSPELVLRALPPSHRFSSNSIGTSSNTTASSCTPRVRFCERVLQVHAESRWGAIVLVDHRNAPGCVTMSGPGGEFLVRDALHLLDSAERAAMVKGELTLCIS